MDNQDLTLERRLKAKDEQIAELLEALDDLLETYGWYKTKRYPHTREAKAIVKAREAIRKVERRIR